MPCLLYEAAPRPEKTVKRLRIEIPETAPNARIVHEVNHLYKCRPLKESGWATLSRRIQLS